MRIVHHVLSRQVAYHGHDADALRAIAQLQAQGIEVTITPKEPAA